MVEANAEACFVIGDRRRYLVPPEKELNTPVVFLRQTKIFPILENVERVAQIVGIERTLPPA